MVNEKLHHIPGVVEQIRYIRLTKKLVINDTFTPYVDFVFNRPNLVVDSSSIYCHKKYEDFKSIQVLWEINMVGSNEFKPSIQPN